jgi:hypothetical protein
MNADDFKYTNSKNYLYRVQLLIEWANKYFAEELGRPVVTLEDLKECAARNIITPEEIFRFRGMGHHRVPGKLPLYLFPQLKSHDEQKLEKAILFAGDGI